MIRLAGQACDSLRTTIREIRGSRAMTPYPKCLLRQGYVYPCTASTVTAPCMLPVDAPRTSQLPAPAHLRPTIGPPISRHTTSYRALQSPRFSYTESTVETCLAESTSLIRRFPFSTQYRHMENENG